MEGLEGSIEVGEVRKEKMDFDECPSRPLPKPTIMQTKLRKKRAYDPSIKRREHTTEIPTHHWPE